VKFGGNATIADGKAQTMVLSERHQSQLQERGIDPELAVTHGVRSSRRLGGDAVAIPFYQGGEVVNWKYRRIQKADNEANFSQDADATKCFWNINALLDETLASEPLIITEGEFDALCAIQAGYVRTISVPDGAPTKQIGDEDTGRKYSYVYDAKTALSDVREIILCVDNDAQGVALLNDLALRLGKARCKWVKYPYRSRDTGERCKDLNEVWQLYGAKGVQQTIDGAQWMRVEGVYRMSELPPVPQAVPHNVGLVGMEQHYNIRAGDLCIVTGIPSHGKSSFINEVACRMVRHHGWSVAFASFEQKPQIDHRRNLRTWFNGKMVRDQGAAEKEKADAWIDANFSFVVPSEDDDVTLEWTLEKCATAILRHGVNMVVIDPWNEMDHVRPPNMSLTEYTGFAIKQFRKMAHKYQVHVIVAAHPTKQQKDKDGAFAVPTLYDISDSAHWYNKADVGIVVHKTGDRQSLIRVAKSRYHDQIGVPGDMDAIFSPESMAYTITQPWEGSVAA
jgi:twinkle protein